MTKCARRRKKRLVVIHLLLFLLSSCQIAMSMNFITRSLAVAIVVQTSAWPQQYLSIILGKLENVDKLKYLSTCFCAHLLAIAVINFTVLSQWQHCMGAENWKKKCVKQLFSFCLATVRGTVTTLRYHILSFNTGKTTATKDSIKVCFIKQTCSPFTNTDSVVGCNWVLTITTRLGLEWRTQSARE
jgi:hypothetical protein